MNFVDFLKFVFEDTTRIAGFFFILLAVGFVVGNLIPSIHIHKHYDKDEKPKG